MAIHPRDRFQSAVEMLNFLQPLSDDAGTTEEPVEVNPTMTVGQGGTADFETIQDAICKARAGEVILLHSGQYSEPIVLSGLEKIRLVGEGAGNVEVLSGGREPVLTITDCQEVRVEGIAFRYTGIEGEFHSAIQVSNSQNVQFVSCHASEARLRAGIEVTDRSQVTIGQSCFTDNRIGIYVHSHSSAEVSDSVCEENLQYGIWAHGPGTSLTLRGNRCDRNGEVGILYSDEAGGMFEDNHCQWNGYHGIVIANRKTQPEPRGDNPCPNHPRAGIFWGEHWRD